MYKIKSEKFNLVELLYCNYRDKQGDNCVHNMIYCNKNINYILGFMDEVKDRFNVNAQNKNGDTIIHSAIKSDCYDQDVLPILEKAMELGFDPTIKNKVGQDVLECAKKLDSEEYTMEDEISSIKNIFDNYKQSLKQSELGKLKIELQKLKEYQETLGQKIDVISQQVDKIELNQNIQKKKYK